MAVRPRNNLGFTLLELLVVIGIIALIAAIAVPSLNSLSGSNNLVTGGRLVSNTLTAARSEAINRRSLVRFEIATTWPSDQSQAYRKYTVVTHDSTSGTDSQLTKWETLPPGVVFKDAPAAPTSGSYFFALNQAQSPALTFGGNTIATDYLEFLPTGALNLDPAHAPVHVRLIHGVASSAGTVSQTVSSNWFEVLVDGLVGRISVSRPL